MANQKNLEILLWGVDRWNSMRKQKLRGIPDPATANLQDANLEGANLEGVDFQAVNLWGANLKRANLQKADLQEANLKVSDLQGANLNKANLQGADLWKADLRGATFVGSRGLTREQMADAIVDGATKLPEYIEFPVLVKRSVTESKERGSRNEKEISK